MDNRHFLYFLKNTASIGAFSCIFVHLLKKRMKDVCSYNGLCVQVRSHLKKVEFLVCLELHTISYYTTDSCYIYVKEMFLMLSV